MGKLTIACMLFCMVGCGAKLAYDSYDKTHDAPDGKVTIKLVHHENNEAKFLLRNNSKYVLRYEHWFGQKKSPVAYCGYKSNEILVCSKSVFLLENEFYTHDTILAPGEKLIFFANIEGANKIGIKFWSQESGKGEIYFWFDLTNGL